MIYIGSQVARVSVLEIALVTPAVVRYFLDVPSDAQVLKFVKWSCRRELPDTTLFVPI